MAFGQPRLAAELNLETVPSRVTLSRRYKQVAPKLEAFIAYLGDIGVSLDTETPPEVIYQDKSLYKAKGSVWHQNITETPTLSPMDFVILTLMQVGQQASIEGGFTGMDFT